LKTTARLNFGLALTLRKIWPLDLRRLPQRWPLSYVCDRNNPEAAPLKHRVQPLLHHHHQAAIIALFRVINRYVGNLPPMPGVFPDYPAPVIRKPDALGHAAITR
jgi:hypothetical protein